MGLLPLEMKNALPIDLLKKVIVVEPRIDLRGIIRDAIKLVAKEAQVLAVGSTEEAFDLLASDYRDITFVVTSMERGPRFNTATLLRQILKNRELSHIKVSVLHTAEETELLPVLFDLGLLSCHLKPTTLQSLGADFAEIHAQLTSGAGHPILVAAASLHRVFAVQGKYKEAADLGKRMIRLFPAEVSLLVRFIEACIAAGDIAGGKRAFQMLRDHPRLDEVAHECERFETTLGNDGSVGFAKQRGYHSLLIVDSDAQALNMLREIAGEIGFGEVRTSENAAQALGETTAEPPDLIICEWRQRGMSCVSFLQKVLAASDKYVPVVLYTGQVRSSDAMTLQDLNIAGVIAKPGTKKDVMAVLMGCMDAEADAGNQHSQKRRFYQAVKTSNIQAARQIRQEAADSGSRYLLQFDAEIAYLSKDFDGALSMALEASVRNSPNLEMIHLLGKVFIRAGDYESAAQFFERANELSAANIERLCLLSEAKSELNEAEEAAQLVEAAKAIDADSEMVKTAEIQLHLKDSNFSEAGVLMGSLNSFDRIVANMNNKAVVMARKGNEDGALGLYDKALRSLPARMKKEQAVLLFNKALAFLRASRMAEAESVLSQVSVLDDRLLADRSRHLKSQMEKARKIGVVLNFSREPRARSQRGFERPWSSYAAPGTLCLHGLYDCGQFGDAKVRALFKDAAGISFQKDLSDQDQIVFPAISNGN